MHALVIPAGSSGDVNPMVGLGRELKRRGHRVTVLANAHFAPVVTRAGLELVEAGSAEDYHRALNNPDLWHPTRGFETVMQHPLMKRVMRQQFEFVRDRHAPGQTLVVSGSLALGARVAQEALGVPQVSVHLQPVIMWSVSDPPVLGNVRLPNWVPRAVVRGFFRTGELVMVDRMMAGLIQPLRAELGLPPVKAWGQYWHSPDAVLATFPTWYATAADWPTQVRQTTFPLYDDRCDEPLAADVQAFVAAGPPPVVATFGSGMRLGKPYFTAAAEGIAKLGRRGVLLTPFREQLPASLPPGVVHFDYAPLGRLLPHAAALVHHGGIGTTAQGLAAGVPQLVMPLAHDQPDNVHRLKRLGVGQGLWPKRFTADRVAALLGELLNDAVVAERCRAYAGRMRGVDGLAWSADELEAVLRQNSSR